MLSKLKTSAALIVDKLRHTDIRTWAKMPKYLVFNLLLPFGRFLILLILYSIHSSVILKLGKYKFIPVTLVSAIQSWYVKIYIKGMKTFDKHEPGAISSLSIMELALNNLKRKKSRTMITIGGVAIGIGAIVFLVSIGYGLQNLVIGKVAKLHEIKQINVTLRQGSREKLSDKLVSDLKNIDNVENILPLIAVVGKVDYNNSISSVAVYGVTTDYIRNSELKLQEGKIFDSNELVANTFDQSVLGAKIVREEIYEEEEFYTYGDSRGKIRYQLNPGTWVRVRDNYNINGKVLGYTKYFESVLEGEEIIGSYYVADSSNKLVKDKNGDELGRWIKAKVDLWEEKKCDVSKPNCFEGKYVILEDENGEQVSKTGYFSLINVNIIRDSATASKEQVLRSSTNPQGEVLGTSDSTTGSVLAEEATTVGTEEAASTPIDTPTTNTTTTGDSTSDDLNIVTDGNDSTWVEIPEESGLVEENTSPKVPLAQSALKQAVVNTAMLQLLGLEPKDAVGKTFNTSFIATGDILPADKKVLESQTNEYSIVGVLTDDKSPIFYVPYVDLKGLGVANNSQLKVIVKDKDLIQKTRTQIESMGFNTNSVVDTIKQINSLFNTIRAVLAVMGMVALSVASLGMFNTFTISLLERTREIGLMKAMGMKSTEVQELFLTESMVMGFSGGVAGLFVGYLMGFVLNAGISAISIPKGMGLISVTHIPMGFVGLILGLSMLVGIGTGVYPALRAKSISALNALRYE